MTEPTPEDLAATQLSPRPIGGRWDLDVARHPTGLEPPQVVATVTDLTGVRVLFLDPDTAEQVAGMMVAKAREARNGGSGRLIVPTDVNLPGLS
jgi:hypothetical protein